MAITGAYGSETAGPSPAALGLAISGGLGVTAEPQTFAALGLAISGGYGGETAGPSPAALGLAISGGLGVTAEPQTFAALGLAISGGLWRRDGGAKSRGAGPGDQRRPGCDR